MSAYLIQDTSLTNIGSSIRAINGESSNYSPAQMKTKLDDVNTIIDYQNELIEQLRLITLNKAGLEIIWEYF